MQVMRAEQALCEKGLKMGHKIDENTFFTLENCPDPKRLLWRTTGRRPVSSNVIFELNSVQRTSPTGISGNYVELHYPRNGVAIVPLFTGSDGLPRFVMERQFRHGTQSVCLEFPAGLVEKTEATETAARRELLEETGLIAGQLTHLGRPCLNTAYMDNYTDIFLAQDLELAVPLTERHLDADEQIDVLSVPVSYVLAHAGFGELNNGSSLLGLLFYLLKTYH